MGERTTDSDGKLTKRSVKKNSFSWHQFGLYGRTVNMPIQPDLVRWASERHCFHILQYNYLNSNSRSKPFNIIFILKCAWKSNFTFFLKFLLLINYFSKIFVFEPLNFVKNVKFDLQAGILLK